MIINPTFGKPEAYSINDILLDQTISYCLKDAIKSASNRDSLDALRDAELLVEILHEKFHKEINSLN